MTIIVHTTTYLLEGSNCVCTIRNECTGWMLHWD